ncbi:hypothetical protein C8J57DRAFT_1333135 [Mycena rebaudengoi]|nr:hypothetical protein C8J57DRAFT_1333135 [Mycena rebaudengoi]
MPTLAIAKEFNASFSPEYVPVFLCVGGTDGVGRGMVEAFARHVHGRAHIIVVGRNQTAAEEIMKGLPKPAEAKFDFVQCDVSLMANVRVACAAIRAKVDRVHFLVITAGYNSMVRVAQTSEGLDLHLAIRYYQRYVFIQELLPLIQTAAETGQHVGVMSVLGAGRGNPARPINLDDLGNTKNRAGRFGTAMKSLVEGSGYTDAMLAHFASHHPTIAFTHIGPGVVRTSAHNTFFSGYLTPLSWILKFVLGFVAITPANCAEYMLYALLTGSRGIFIRSATGDIISSHTFDAPLLEFDELSPTAHTTVRLL